MSSKNKIQDFAARREERRKKLRDLEIEDQPFQFISNFKRPKESSQINIIKVQNITPTSNCTQNLHDTHFVKPSTIKRLKTHKSPPFIQKYYSNAPKIELNTQTQLPINTENPSLRFSPHLKNIEKKVSQNVSPLKQSQHEVVVEKRLSQEQKPQQTATVPRQNIVLQENNEEFTSDTSQESNISNKMRHWQNLTNFEMYNQVS